MDYLDPKKKKLKKIRLFIGYGLLGIAMSIATVVFVYLANGYYVDSETGSVIQNGLIYVDSKPESASVYLNGVKQRGVTDARLVVPEGLHEIKLQREGYREWSRSLTLEGGSLRRLTYARLVPETLDSELAVNLPVMPNNFSQSLDKRWVVMTFASTPLSMNYIDMNNNNLQLEELPLPVGLIETKADGLWEILDWADDNKTFLAKYSTPTTNEYVLIDRDNPEISKNLKAVFTAQKFDSASLRNGKKDLVFLHSETTGALFRGDADTGEMEPYLNDVVQYASFGNDDVLFVSEVNAKEGYVQVTLRDKDKEYDLREIKKDKEYLLEISKLSNALIIGAGSSAEGRIIVYNDPINALKKNDFSNIPVPTTVLRVDSPEELSISADSSVILARGGQSVASHEFEADRSYRFELEAMPDSNQEMKWIDGQHLRLSEDGVQVMVDFDGSNEYKLSKSVASLGSFFDDGIDFQFTFLPPAEEGSAARLMRTFMRTQADR